CTRCHHQYISASSPHTSIYALSLHDALPISPALIAAALSAGSLPTAAFTTCPVPQRKAFTISARLFRPPKPNRGTLSFSREPMRSDEHTSELQSRFDLVCRLLLEKKNNSPNS